MMGRKMLLTPTMLKGFNKKWVAIRTVERDEARKLSFQQKFHRTASLIRMGSALNIDFNEDNEKRAVRRRWAFLKKNIK